MKNLILEYCFELMTFTLGKTDLHLQLEIYMNCSFLSLSVDDCANIHSYSQLCQLHIMDERF